MKTLEARVIENIRYFVDLKRTEIWVRRDKLEVAKTEFQRLKADGTITDATFRPEFSNRGSANFLVQYLD